jgi:hypothetical protein
MKIKNETHLIQLLLNEYNKIKPQLIHNHINLKTLINNSICIICEKKIDTTFYHITSDYLYHYNCFTNLLSQLQYTSVNNNFCDICKCILNYSYNNDSLLTNKPKIFQIIDRLDICKYCYNMREYNKYIIIIPVIHNYIYEQDKKILMNVDEPVYITNINKPKLIDFINKYNKSNNLLINHNIRCIHPYYSSLFNLVVLHDYLNYNDICVRLLVDISNISFPIYSNIFDKFGCNSYDKIFNSFDDFIENFDYWLHYNKLTENYLKKLTFKFNNLQTIHNINYNELNYINNDNNYNLIDLHILNFNIIIRKVNNLSSIYHNDYICY